MDGRSQRQVAFLVALGSLAAMPECGLAEGPATGSVVLFNTVCAQCHEMECSRRLTFPPESSTTDARGHVQNYAGHEGLSRMQDLLALIAFTKTRCDYYAPKVPIPADGIWSSAALAPLATPDRTGWFVPLGELPAGSHLLRLEIASRQAIDIEVLTRTGVVAEERVAAASHEAHVSFRVVAPGTPHFLRLRSRTPVTFRAAALTTIPAGAASR